MGRIRYIRFTTASSGLLISCAMVAAMRPVAAIFSACNRDCSSRRRTEISRKILDAPITLPCSSRIGEMVRETSSRCPVLVRRTVSKYHTASSPDVIHDHLLIGVEIVRDKFQDRRANHFVCGITEKTSGSCIPAGNDAVQIFAQNHIILIVDRQWPRCPKMLGIFLLCLLASLDLGDIPNSAEKLFLTAFDRWLEVAFTSIQRSV